MHCIKCQHSAFLGPSAISTDGLKILTDLPHALGSPVFFKKPKEFQPQTRLTRSKKGPDPDETAVGTEFAD